MENLTQHMRHIPDMDEAFGGPAPAPIPSQMPTQASNMTTAIHKATGLNINPEQLVNSTNVGTTEMYQARSEAF